MPLSLCSLPSHSKLKSKIANQLHNNLINKSNGSVNGNWVGIQSGIGGDVLAGLGAPKKPAGWKKFKGTRHPVYCCVRRGDGGKWVCELRNRKSRLWLGTYLAPEMAARVHDVAVLALRGCSACLNFADSAWLLPFPSSVSDADIRAAAIEAAEVFRRACEEGASSSGSGLEQEEAVSDAELSSSSADLRAEEDWCTMTNEHLAVNGGAGCSYYLDEEAIFSSPGQLLDMAEALIVAPPPIVLGVSSNHWTVTPFMIQMFQYGITPLGRIN